MVRRNALSSIADTKGLWVHIAMLGFLAALMALAQAPSPAPAVEAEAALPSPPADWASLPELRFKRPWPEAPAVSEYVRDEVRAGRCTLEGNRVTVEMAVLVASNGQVRRIRPRAIQCPTVEQYASGVLSRMARSNVAAPGEDRWYHTSLVFEWQ